MRHLSANRRLPVAVALFGAVVSLLACAPAARAARPAAAADAGAGALREAVAWLDERAEQAVVAGQLPRAVTLLRALTALAPHDPSPLYRLGEVYALAGDYDAAVAEYRHFLERPESDTARRARAEAEAHRLEEATPPAAEAVFRPIPANAEARHLFDLGQRAAKQKRWEHAVPMLQAAVLLDPDLPGPYRLLGAVYGKTGDRGEEVRFLADYLRVRPDGAIADSVRARLRPLGELGRLSVDASFPCHVTINGRAVGKATPLRGLELPAGSYLVGLENERYHIVRLLRLEVRAGQETQKHFGFGVLETRLDPWARVRVDGKDVGLWDEVGIPEGTHTITYKSHDGSREKSVTLIIKGAERERLSW